MNNVKRLIQTFIPTAYQLSIDISQRAARTFSGIVTITGTMPMDASYISVHAKDLTIDTVLIDGKTATHTPDINDEIQLSTEHLMPGEHVITIGYHGTITDPMHGLYPCYFTVDGEKKELLMTQFESHFAREAFPCIDEPEAKATFDVILTTETGVETLGNMPIKAQNEEDGKLVTTFETTPKMSTYLLAWVVGELQYKEAKTASGVDVRVWSTKAHSLESLDFPLTCAVDSINFYDEYFDTPYPLPKSDLVAVPDFSNGAMENWGLITYREAALLADPKTVSVSTKQYIHTVVSHELAHQWFGNLVTMKWWNNLWLNESFATVMEYYATSVLHPEWNMWSDFNTGEAPLALTRDAIDGVQSVQTDVHHPDEISALFDGAIVYAKGARLMHMLQTFIGEDAFKQGLRTYFKKNAYGNTEGDDLWNELSTTSNFDVAAFMNAWISQPGFPVVDVSRDNNTITLTQSQFFIGRHQASERLWPIPLGANCSDAPKIFDTKTMQFTTELSGPLLLNVGNTAHFITRYDEATFNEILECIEHGTLDETTRLQIVFEQVLLARANLIPHTQLLALLDVFANESSSAVWDTLVRVVQILKLHVRENSDAETKLKQRVTNMALPQFKKLGWVAREGESTDDTKMRATIIGLLIYAEEPEVMQHAIKTFDTTSFDEMDPELRSLIISAKIKADGSRELIDSLLNTYRHSASPEIRHDIAGAFSSRQDSDDLAYVLGFIEDKATVRPQDAIHWYYAILGSKYGQDDAWRWLREQWDWVKTTFDGDKSHDLFVRYSAMTLVTRKQLEEYRDFFGPMEALPGFGRTVAMGDIELESRVEMLEKNRDAVCASLIQN